nr:hypothetical protein [Streptomyces cadmiisoli]
MQRQYAGTAGRIENSQVCCLSRLLHPAGPCGDRPGTVRSALLDRGPGPLPGCRDAGMPDTVGFTMKPALATRMIGCALDAGVPASWVAGDEVCGAIRTCEPSWRDAIGYVLAVARDHQITTRAGKLRADTLVKKLPKRAW